MYKPPSAGQFSTPIRVQHRVETDVNGADEISYTDADPALDFCNWKGKGGTQSVDAASIVVEDTAELTMWYRPDISQQDRVLKNDDAALAYEIIGPPENIEERNQFLLLKVKRVVNA